MQDLSDALSDPDFRAGLVWIAVGGVISLALGVVVHEAGHVLCGRLAGYRIRMVRLGRGPTLLRLRIGLGLLVVNALPVSGAVSTYRALETVRRKRVLLIAGGCMANAAAAAALIPLIGWPPDTLAHPVLATMGIVQALAILNVVVMVGPGRRGTTDGGLLRDALRRPARTHDRLVERLYAREVAARHPSLPPAPPSRLGAVVLHAALIGTPAATYKDLAAMEAPQASADRARLRRSLLAHTDLTAAERATLLDALLTDALLGLTEARPEHLEAWSAALVALVPQDASARATRGAALVTLGRPDGRALLEEALEAEMAQFPRALTRAFLAKALAREGDPDGAAILLTAVRADLAAVPGNDGSPAIAALLEAIACRSECTPRNAPADRERVGGEP